MVTIRQLKDGEINSDMLRDFRHHQVIRCKYVETARGFCQQPACEVGEWDEAKKIRLAEWLRQQASCGGSVIGAFLKERLVGFACVDAALWGSNIRYANLTMLFVEDDQKRKGIGRALFHEAAVFARQLGAHRLFISSVPSVETVAFYFQVGCTDAPEKIPDFIDTDEDRCLVYQLEEL